MANANQLSHKVLTQAKAAYGIKEHASHIAFEAAHIGDDDLERKMYQAGDKALELYKLLKEAEIGREDKENKPLSENTKTTDFDLDNFDPVE